MSFRVYFEIGHEAAIRSKRTDEGFTHDWEVYVQGLNGVEVHHFVEKVVFQLHDTFPNPKRVIKEPPYTVRESGYAGFTILIEIYFRNNEEPKKIKLKYELDLQQQGPAISKKISHKYTFTNPSEEFRHKLLKAGLTPTDDGDKNKTSKISSVSDPLKKYKFKDVHKQEDSFTDLFGTPLTKTSIKMSEFKAPVKNSPISGSVVSPKLDKNLVVNKKNKSKHVSKEKDKERDSEKKEKSTEKKHKEEKKSKERSKDKERKEKLKNDSQSPSPKRPATPTKQVKEEKIKDENKKEETSSSSSSKSKLDKQIKEDSKSSKDDDNKSIIKEEKKKSELLQMQMPPTKNKKEGKDRDKDKESSKKEHKSHKESKEYKEKKLQELTSSNKKDSIFHNKKEKEPIKELSENSSSKPEKQSKNNSIITSEKSSIVPEEKPAKHKHKKKENKEKKEKKDEKVKEKESKKKDKTSFFDKIFKEEKKTASTTLENNNKTRGLSALQSQMGISSDSDSHSSLDDSSMDVPSVDIDEPSSDKKRKRKHENNDAATRSDEPPPKQSREKTIEPKIPENVQNDQPEETTSSEMSPEYINCLKELQQKIMTLQDNTELQRVVQMIAETGHYEITPQTFDFDLCALDRDTVRRLQEFFAVS